MGVYLQFLGTFSSQLKCGLICHCVLKSFSDIQREHLLWNDMQIIIMFRENWACLFTPCICSEDFGDEHLDTNWNTNKTELFTAFPLCPTNIFTFAFLKLDNNIMYIPCYRLALDPSMLSNLALVLIQLDWVNQNASGILNMLSNITLKEGP